MSVYYNVHFSPKPGVDANHLIELCRTFARALESDELIAGFQILRITDAASFPDIPQFHLIVRCDSPDQMAKTFALIKKTMHEPPHGEIMRMVGDFRVTFADDVTA